ncbi:MAG: DUF4347 domain-containing protein [Acidovorax sp.]|nr:DUF4347 domain-containing protein [Acidovorax sp.]
MSTTITSSEIQGHEGLPLPDALSGGLSMSSSSAAQVVHAHIANVVFVDSTLPNWRDLLKGVPADAEVVVLDASKNGISQMADYLKDKVGVDSVHILSHGGDGYLLLGNTLLSSHNIDDYQAKLAQINKAIAPGGDIFLYGCDVARSEVGVDFVSQLSHFTGADVAASTNDTGVSGDWVLEYRSGEISQPSLSASNYQFDLATIKVTNLNDSGAGSLRAAIASATGNAAADTIVFDPALFASGAATLTLTSGELNVDSPDNADALTIIGAGENLLTISGNNSSRIFAAYGANNTSALTLSGMTLTNAKGVNGDSGWGGGAITFQYSGSLSLDHVVITNSTATRQGAGLFFYQAGAALNISNSTISNNTSSAANASGNGAGAYVSGAQISISNTTISGNSGNGLGRYGGGVSVFAGTSATLTNVTIANNSTGQGTDPAGGGGGIAIGGAGATTITNSTIVGNSFTGANSANSGGGGVYVLANTSGSVTVKNTIVANNSSTNATVNDSDIFIGNNSTLSGGNNIVTTTIGTVGSGTNSLTGTIATLGSALGSLAFNGGAVQTISIATGSTAISAGTSTGAPTTDARGFGRGGTTDIGAFEYSENDIFHFTGVMSPANGFIDVPVGYDLFIDFGRGVSAVAAKNITIYRQSDNAVLETIAANDGAKVTLSSGVGGANSKVTINPAANLNGLTAYYVLIDSGAFQDGSGNVFNGIASTSSWAFTSAALPAPAVTGVTSSTANGSYKVGDVVSVQVSFDGVVTVAGGPPQLTLETGATDRVVDYASGSGTNTLTFNYTVQAGDTTADLNYVSTSALALNGGTIRDAGSNDATLTLPALAAAGSLGVNKAIVIDTAAPTVSSVGVPANATYLAGQNLDFTVNFSESVTVTGVPQLDLTLDTGGTVAATYLSGSGTSALVFRYTTAIGNLDSNGVSLGGSIALNAGLLKDAAGNDANLSLNSVGALAGVLVDAVVPVVSSVDVPANATYALGQNLSFTVNFSESVTVTGSPQLALTLDTGGTVAAAYVSGSGSSALVFQYTVASGNLDSSGISLGGSVALNGGTLKDASGNNAQLTLNSVGALSGVLVDGVAPVISSINRVGSASTNATSVDYTVTFAEGVTGVDSSDFALTATGTVAGSIASVTPVSGSIYTVTVNSITGDGTLRLDLKNAGTGIADAVSNAIASGYISGQLYTLDTTGPTVSSVNASTASGTYKVGDVIAIEVTFNEAVTVAGTPQLTLETGTTDRMADFAFGSGTSTLTFNYTVQAGDTAADLDYLSTAALSLNGGSILDGASNPAVLTLAAPGAAGSLGANKNIVIDGIAPALTGDGVPTDGTYATGQHLDFTVTYDQVVTVDTGGGTPSIALTLDTGGSVQAAYLSGSGSNTLTFRYTVVAGNADTNGVAAASSISLNGGTLRDGSGNDAAISGITFASTSGVRVDAVPPAVSSINRVGSASTNATSVDYTVTFAEGVTGVDSSDFALTATGTVAGSIASVTPVSGSIYTVTVNSITGDGTLRLDLKNAGTGIADAVSNAIASGYTSGQTYTLDTTVPTVTSVDVPANATYTAGQTLDFTVNFGEAVVVNTTGGVPRLAVTLDAGGTAYASYQSGGGTTALTFRMTVVAGQIDMNGITVGVLQANGGTLKDAAGNNAQLTLAGVAPTTGVLVNAPAPVDPEPPVVPPVTPPVTPPTPGVPDNDGIPPAVEDQAPGIPGPGGNTTPGDGNGDGIKDSEQPSVGSVGFVLSPTGVSNPGSAPPTFTTLVASSQNGKVGSGNDNSRITSLTQKDAPADAPAGLQTPIGLVSFTVELAPGKTSESFSLYLDPALGVNGYWKQDSTGTWINIASEPYGGKMVLEGGRVRLDFQITDGGQFDADGKVDGVITDPGAPGHMPLSIVGQAPDMGHHPFWF